jgi:hypothetical protein
VSDELDVTMPCNSGEVCEHGEPAKNCGICEDIHALQNRIELLESAVRAMAHELAVWRSMPHLDHILSGYWADIQFEDMMALMSGRLVNENQIARDAVNAAMAKEAK